jgi:hypothetical protein
MSFIFLLITLIFLISLLVFLLFKFVIHKKPLAITNQINIQETITAENQDWYYRTHLISTLLPTTLLEV